MNDASLKVILVEGGTSEASVNLRTFTTAAGQCHQSYVMSRSTSLLEALQKHGPDVALLQMLVLQPDPAATVSHLHECAPEVALIVWAEPADEETAAKCIGAGANDYILEGFTDGRTLDRVLRTAITAKAGPPTTLISSIDDEVCSGSVPVPRCEYQEAAPSEHPEPSILAES